MIAAGGGVVPGPRNDKHEKWLFRDDGSIVDFVSTSLAVTTSELAQVGAQLVAAEREPDLRVSEAIELVEAADLRGQEIVVQLTAQFLAGGANTESQPQVHIWDAVTLYLRQLASAYVSLVRMFQTYGKGWGQVGDQLPLVLARAIRATALRLKWQKIRYRPVQAEIWQILSRLWSYVEDKGLISARVMVYENDISTLKREIVRPLMFAMSAVDTVSPQEIDVAEKLTAFFAGHFDLQRHAGKGCHFVVDIHQWAPPERYENGENVRLGSRFFGPAEAIAEIDLVSTALAADAISLSQVKLHDVDNVEVVVEVLAHLQRHWSANRPERREERHRALATLFIVSDYARIIECIASNETGATLENQDKIELWGVENESEGGYGAVLPNERGERLHIGELIGLRPSRSRLWAIGVIRRLAARDVARRYVGIELLARGVRTVLLFDAENGGQVQRGILLPSHIGESAGLGEINLLLAADTFSPDGTIEMNVFDKHYHLEPLLTLETGKNFAVARYRIRGRID